MLAPLEAPPMRLFPITVLLALAGPSLAAPPRIRGKGRPAGGEQLIQGNVWALAGRCDEAVKCYRKASASDPRNSTIRVRLAHCLARTGQPAEAHALLVAAGAEPGRAGAEALQEIGDLALAAGDFAGAASAYDQAIARGGNATDARVGLLDALAGLAKRGDGAARTRALDLAARLKIDRLVDRTAQRHAEEVEAVLTWGDAAQDFIAAKNKLAAGDARGAIAALLRVVAAHPEIEEAQYLLGVACASPEIARRDEARRAWRKAPHVKEALFALGVDAYEGGDLDEAALRFQAALASDGDYQAAHYQIGLVHKERGEIPEAKRAWARAAAIDPKSELGRWASTKLQVLTGNVHSLAEGQVLDSASEVAIGQELSRQLEKQFGRLEDAALQARLDRILKRLTGVSDRPPGELRYRVVLVDVPMVNALTLPGGTILFFRGLIDLVQKKLGDTDDAFAAVLAHECAHAALRHGMGMVTVASSLAQGRAFNGAGDLADLMNTVSRAHEFEADQFGALYSYRAGFDPAATLGLFDGMRRELGEIPRGMNHPTHAERIARVRDYLLDLRAKVRGFDLAVKALKENDLEGAASRFEVFLGVFPESTSARSNLGVAMHRKALSALPPSTRFRRSTDVDPNSRARKIELRAGEVGGAGLRAGPKIDERLLREAASEYEAALAIDPSYPSALVNLGAALDDLKDRKRARQILERAVAVAPQSKEAWNNLGAVAAGSGDSGRARVALQRAIVIDGSYADAWFNLAMTCEQAAKDKDAAAAWDRYLVLDGKSGWSEIAREHRARIK
ncbi:MAG: tetratricopeptide repeat protein [Myxococcales bacterium]|nr:tetratricopeptide repeat protein [Myxococcales bacterium]